MSLSVRKSKQGFTLVELMVVILILGILAAMAIPNYVNRRKQAIDAQMKSDLHNCFIALEDYALQHDGLYPAASGALEVQTSFHLSPGVVWDIYSLENVGGDPSVHIHLAHPRSDNKWHAHYPAESTRIEPR